MIKVGLVGLGWVAQNAYIPSLFRIPEVKITAACTRDSAHLNEICSRYSVEATFTDHVEMAQNSDIDCVIVLTRPETHAEISRTFLENEIHVLCEKPMALRLQEAEELVRTAKQYQRIYGIAFSRRFAPVYRKAKEVFQDRNINLCYSLQNCAADRMAFPASLTTQTLLKTPQAVDTLRFFCGEAVEVNSAAQFTDRSMEKTVTGIMHFDSGALGVLVNDYTGGLSDEKIELYGEGITVHANVHDQIASIWQGESTAADGVHPAQPKISTQYATTVSSDYYYKYGFLGLITDFIDCVRENRQSPSSAEDALKTHQLVNEIYRHAGLQTFD